MEHVLSARGQQLVASPPLAPYILEHFARVEDAWDPSTNPNGYIALCIAENRMMWDTLVPQLRNYRDIPPRVLGYDAMIGNLEFRQKLAAFMSRAFLGRAVQAEQLAAVAGAGTVLELLFHVIADPGDAVLVPTPSYAGFWADLETRDQLYIIPVHCRSADGFRLRTDALDRAIAQAERPVKALLFTTPNNPLGTVYTREDLLEILEWSDRVGVHVVFDEIYALSVFGERPFVSVASLRASLGPRAHVVWAFSKDFGASGLRCGVLMSENPAVIAAVDALAYWAACSGDTQWLLGELVADRDFVDPFIDRMQAGLGQAHAQLCAALDAHGIAHLPAEAGFFVICDLRRHLDEPSWAAEDRLWRRIVDEANVNLTPGSACRIVEPGFFRLCYASEPTQAVIEGVARLARVLAPRA
ncbi:aminotransferase class I/II-fold pyridoxal phosphate-dependent enzyme [Enhygromyxa salina]|uniref:Aspartate aminotransferase n=1 Tax=Enhygromyxa salina TaxID=215803 RepID=A0A2S9YFT7_9BACT|nr:aminotransferase class I/II-fold pyridoxal phosphate-dependent enzyme [Enhygromyxa salina]PRQ03912.1 Aspartate aminotransferase [Enhygromyxa salina]